MQRSGYLSGTHPADVRAVKIPIEADEHQVRFLRNNILVGIVEVDPEHGCGMFNPHDILTAEREDGDPSFAKEIPDKFREEPGCLFLVENDPD